MWYHSSFVSKSIYSFTPVFWKWNPQVLLQAWGNMAQIWFATVSFISLSIFMKPVLITSLQIMNRGVAILLELSVSQLVLLGGRCSFRLLDQLSGIQVFIHSANTKYLLSTRDCFISWGYRNGRKTQTFLYWVLYTEGQRECRKEIKHVYYM